MIAVDIRPAEIADLNFIMSSWHHSYKRYRETDADTQRQIMCHLLQCCPVAVATAPTDAGQIYGWACAEPTAEGLLLHYVYVKEILRKQGICRQLLQSFGCSLHKLLTSHKTYAMTFSSNVTYCPEAKHGFRAPRSNPQSSRSDLREYYGHVS